MPQMANHQWQYILNVMLLSIFLLLPAVILTKDPLLIPAPTIGLKNPELNKGW